MINVIRDFSATLNFSQALSLSLSRLLSYAVFTGKSKFPVEIKFRFIPTKIRIGTVVTSLPQSFKQAGEYDGMKNLVFPRIVHRSLLSSCTLYNAPNGIGSIRHCSPTMSD